jgi:hypothetical protein
MHRGTNVFDMSWGTGILEKGEMIYEKILVLVLNAEFLPLYRVCNGN